MVCRFCNNEATEKHHVIEKHDCCYLKKFDLNIIMLCKDCHAKIHLKNQVGKELRVYIKNFYHREILKLIKKTYYKPDELKELLGIGNNALNSLLEGFKEHKEGYLSSDVITALAGLKIKNKRGMNYE